MENNLNNVRPATPPAEFQYEGLRSVLSRHRSGEFAAVKSERRRHLVAGLLLGVVLGLVIMVCSEIAALPEGAMDGLLLNAQIELANLRQSSEPQKKQTPTPQRPSHRARNHDARKEKARRAEDTHALAQISGPAVTNPAGIQIVPVKALRPFTLEVVDGDHRQNVLARHHAVHVEIAGPDSLGYQVYRESGSPTLRAIIDQAGRIEDAWLVSGPALPMETLRNVTTARYGPYLQNGAPVDMETLIVVNAAPNKN
jgi:hypothetical protein